MRRHAAALAALLLAAALVTWIRLLPLSLPALPDLVTAAARQKAATTPRRPAMTGTRNALAGSGKAGSIHVATRCTAAIAATCRECASGTVRPTGASVSVSRHCPSDTASHGVPCSSTLRAARSQA